MEYSAYIKYARRKQYKKGIKSIFCIIHLRALIIIYN